MAQRVKVATFDAVGGPAALIKAPDGYWAGPTDKGVYRMARCSRYFKSGNLVVVHGYDEKVPSLPDDATGTRPFEVHFFPGARQVVMTGRQPSVSRK